MTHLFQSLDFRVNKLAKDFIKQSFSKWFSRKVNIDLEIGHELDDVVVDYQLSVLKPLHKKWLISIYNHMSNSEVKEIILSDWKTSGILDAIHLGSTGLPPLEPFVDLCSLMEAAGRNLSSSS